jgi:hypothetical protein
MRNTTLGASLETLAPTNFPRTDLITAFLTGFAGVNQQATVTPSEMLRLNTAMGRLCHPIPVAGTDTDLELCSPEDANVGTVPFTDGAPVNALMMGATFPYLATPLAGSK